MNADDNLQLPLAVAAPDDASTDDRSEVAWRDRLDDRRRAWAPRARRDAALLVAVAVAGDLAVHHGTATVSGALAAATPAALVVATGAPRRRAARLALAASLACAAALLWRRSGWLVPLDALAAAALALLAITLDARDRRAPLQLADLASAAHNAGAVLVRSPMDLALVGTHVLPLTDAAHRRRARSVARGLGLGLPVAALLAALLASADGVFRSFLRVPVPVSGLPGHLAAGTLAACAGVVPLVLRGQPALVPRRRARTSRAPRRPLGATELATALAVVGAVALLFAAAQATAILRGDEYVLRTTGLTYAEHARRGYFQLLAAAALAALVLLAARALRPAEVPRRIRIPGAVTAAAMLVIVVAALRRLALYNTAFGWTTLRLACVVFALWLAVAFALMATSLAGRGRPDRLVGALVVSAMITLGVWNVLDPDTFVADRNLARDAARAELDVAYLARLSDDAVPRLVDAARDSGPDARALRDALCARDRDRRGALAWNRSAARAATRLDDLCR